MGSRGFVSAAVLMTACLAFGSVYEDLQPQARQVEVREGTCADPARVTVVRAAVPGVRAELAAEAYRLTVASDGVTIEASDPRGERYARMTLDQLVRLSDGPVPCGTVTDWPEHRWRGLMHDCGRNYLDMTSIKRILDLMARYKYNLFHWHITDYYGWRLESKKYPMLQAPWAFRRQMSKFYTQKEFREILDYAKARGITVMPELDVPGHSLAFRRGLDIEHMAERKVKGIVCDLIDELCSLADADEMPFIHLGTDEARTPWEMVPDSYCPAWADQVRKNGRLPVGWHPGKPMVGPNGEKSVKMIWHDGLVPESDESVFDTVRLYFGGMDAMNLANVAAFTKPFRYPISDERKLGPVLCSWHDDMVGEDTSRTLLDVHFGPAIVMYASLMWEHRDADRGEYVAKLPLPGTADHDAFVRFEKRIALHRDRVVGDIGMPFAFVRQGDLRWRVSDGNGKVVAKDVPQGTVYFWKFSKDGPDATNSYFNAKTGTGVMETWIRSETAREIGAWIGFTHYGRSGGRGRGIPERGEWETSKGVTVEVNGAKIAPPEWVRAGVKSTMTHPEEPTSNYLAELPFTNEEYWMRPPAKIALVAGWNHVKITVPHPTSRWNYNWCGTFVPVAGTSEHPREVEGLVCSSEPPDIGDVIRASVAAGDVAGVVSVVTRPDYSTRVDCAGYADIERKVPMRPDTVFALFSCSKSVCGTAVMALVADGKLGLDDPVAKYIPEFADVKVETKGADGKVALVPPKRPVTVRDVMSHVSGSRYSPPIIRRDFPLVECARRMAKTPFKFQPGETFSYNNAGIDTGGAVVEVVSGVDYESFCRARIFDPLGMKDTTFTPNADQIARLARCYNADGKPFVDQAKAGALYAGRPYAEQTLLPAPHKIYPAPSAGLYSTPNDFCRYSQMLAHHGEWKGVRILPEKLFRETYVVKQTADSIESPYTIGNWIRGEWFGHSGALKSDQRVNVRTGHSRCYFAQIMPPGGEGFEHSKDAWNLAVDAIQCPEGATPCLDHSTKRTSRGKVKVGR